MIHIGIHSLTTLSDSRLRTRIYQLLSAASGFWDWLICCFTRLWPCDRSQPTRQHIALSHWLNVSSVTVRIVSTAATMGRQGRSICFVAVNQSLDISDSSSSFGNDIADLKLWQRRLQTFLLFVDKSAVFVCVHKSQTKTKTNSQYKPKTHISS